jgi:RHS repeat-associated protein
LIDFAGAIAELYAFDAYGNAIGFDPSVALTEFLYSGEQFDSKIGQQYLRQRYYDPATGRFNRLDPFFGNLTDPQSLHKYLYTHADPVNGIDPSGKFSAVGVGIAISIGAVIGGIGGTVYGSMRYGFGTAGMWRATGIGALIGGSLAGGGYGLAWWGYSSAVALSAGGKISISSWGLLTSIIAFLGPMLYLKHSIGADLPNLRVNKFTQEESELIQTVAKTCDRKDIKHHLGSAVYVGIFDKGEFDSASLAAGRPWSVLGPHVILADVFFDRYNNPEYSNDAFKSQVITILHEASHVGTWDFYDDPVEANNPPAQHAENIWDQIKNEPEILQFINETYNSFIISRATQNTH